MKSASGQVTRDNIKNYIISEKKGLERQEFARLYRSVLLWNGASTIWANLNLVQNSYYFQFGNDKSTFSERSCQKYLLSPLQRF